MIFQPTGVGNSTLPSQRVITVIFTPSDFNTTRLWKANVTTENRTLLSAIRHPPSLLSYPAGFSGCGGVWGLVVALWSPPSPHKLPLGSGSLPCPHARSQHPPIETASYTINRTDPYVDVTLPQAPGCVWGVFNPDYSPSGLAVRPNQRPCDLRSPGRVVQNRPSGSWGWA